MLSFEKLCLEEALEDSPQMRNFRHVFEDDAVKLKSFATDLQSSLQNLHSAHMAMGDALQSVVKTMRRIGTKDLPLDCDNGQMKDAVEGLCQYVDEINSQLAIQASEINDTLLSPIEAWLSGDFEALTHNQRLLGIIEEQLDASLQNYMRLPRQCTERQHQESVQDVFQMRRKFHNTALLYYALMNQLQYRRYSVPLHILCNLVVSFRGFHQRSWEALQKPDLVTQLENAGAMVNNLREEDKASFEQSSLLRREMDQQATSAYFPEFPVAPVVAQQQQESGSPLEEKTSSQSQSGVEHLAPCLTLSQTSGYLFFRGKTTVLTNARWQRTFFFTQAEHLMVQAKGNVAGSSLVDLTEGGVYAEPTEVDDRRNVFQVVCPTSKKTIFLQAENSRDRDQWIATIMNIVSAHGNVTVRTPASSQRPSVTSPSMSSIATANTSSAGDGVMAFFSNVFHRSSVASGNNSATATSPTSSPSMNAGTFDRGNTVEKLMAWFEQQPIAFELSEEAVEEASSSVTHDEAPGEGGSDSTERRNPFSAHMKLERADGTSLTLPCSTDASAVHTFPVHFVGSVEVPSVSGEVVATEAMRYMSDSRMQHNMFNMGQFLLIVSSEGVWILEEASASPRRYFPLNRISLCAAYKDNPKLVGLVISSRQTSGQVTHYCYALDCAAGSEVVAAVRESVNYARSSRHPTQESADPAADFERSLILTNISRLPDEETSSSSTRENVVNS